MVGILGGEGRGSTDWAAIALFAGIVIVSNGLFILTLWLTGWLP